MTEKHPQIVEWSEVIDKLDHPEDRAAARAILIGWILDAVPEKLFREAINDVKEKLKL